VSGYVFSDIKRARSMLLRALPDMFHYLDNPLIPTSTNGLEGKEKELFPMVFPFSTQITTFFAYMPILRSPNPFGRRRISEVLRFAQNDNRMLVNALTVHYG